MNEDEPNPAIREKIVHKQSGRRFWLIFDENALMAGTSIIPQWTQEKIKQECQNEKAMWQADSILTLAQKIGLNSDKLKQTVCNFNQNCEDESDPDFGRNFMNVEDVFPIQNAPYYAIFTYAYSLITFGGLVTNKKLQVLNEDNKPIEGLYAAGEIMGVSSTSGNAFCGGMVLTPALSFGKYLGETL